MSERLEEISVLLERVEQGDIILHAPIAKRLKDECGYLLEWVEKLERENERLRGVLGQFHSFMSYSNAFEHLIYDESLAYVDRVRAVAEGKLPPEQAGTWETRED